MRSTVPAITDNQRIHEITGVLLTAAGKFVFMDLLQWKFAFIVCVAMCWSAYVILKQRKIRGILSYWGFRYDNFNRVLRMLLPFGLLSVAGFIVLGYYQDTLNLTWHIIPILILYPLWGIVQQFLVIGLVAGNLQALNIRSLRSGAIIVLTATLFGILHYPYLWLMIGTFVLALLYGFIYLKSRNLYVLGLFHGWLGGLFFYTVVDRDPFAEVFGPFL